jgi:hypothetical protein
LETIAEFWPFEPEQQKAILYVALSAFAGLAFLLCFALVRKIALLPEAILRLFSGWPSIAAPIVRAEKAIRNFCAAVFVIALGVLIIDIQINGMKIDFEEIWEDDLEDLGESVEEALD